MRLAYSKPSLQQEPSLEVLRVGLRPPECCMQGFLLRLCRSHPSVRVESVKREALQLIEMTETEEPLLQMRTNFRFAAIADFQPAIVWVPDRHLEA